MPPAFSSTKSAAAFVLLLLFLLAAPWLAAQKWWPPRQSTYSTESVRWEKLPWLQKLVQETNDIDVAFVGSSHLLFGIDTPYVQQKLDERLGRKTVVRSICFRWSGFDFLYFITKELLAHRRIKTLVFNDECSMANPEEFHALTPFWFRYGNDGALSGLPFKNQSIYYYAAMLGMPREVMAVVAPNLPNDPDLWRTGAWGYFHAPNPESTLGCLRTRLCFDLAAGISRTNFTPFVPSPDGLAADVRIFSPATATNFVFSTRSLPANQIYFARQFMLLAKSHGCHLVELHLPVYYPAERRSPVMTESRNWFDLLQTKGCLLGIANERLFAGLSESAISRLYYDNAGHLNENGQRYFTSVITPALLQDYESHASN